MSIARAFFAALSLAWLSGPVWAQCQVQKIAPSDGEQDDEFGLSVAVSGDWAIVGAPYEDDGGSEAGAAYLFHRSGGSWTQTQRLKASDVTNGVIFGDAVAIDGDIAVVGSPFRFQQGIQAAGVVYVFERTSDTWNEVAKLGAQDPNFSAFLGISVGISGTTIIAGAPGETHVGQESGAAYIFEKQGSTWSQTAKLVASDGTSFDRFGTDVALDGSVAVMGAQTADQPTAVQGGAAYVFERQGSVWIETAKLVPSDLSHLAYFGYSVSVSGDVVVGGAPNQDRGFNSIGAAYVFERAGSTWVETAKLTPLDADSSDLCGGDVAVDGMVILVTNTNDDDVAPNAGAVCAYRKELGGWIQVAKFQASDGSHADIMGHSTAIDGDTLLVSVIWDDMACPAITNCNSGSAYFFAVSTDAIQYGSCWTGSVCTLFDGHGGCPNSTGQGATLSACGSGSVAADDLVLEARWLPPSVNGLFFFGGAQATVQLGDGIRVVGSGSSGLYRLPVQQASAEGVIVRGPGIVQSSQAFLPPGPIQPGETRYFQLWYRDVNGPCGAFTNLSNGVQVSFGP